MLFERFRLTTPLALAGLFFLSPLFAATIHVDDSAPGGGDGSSWALAFDDLQDALDGAAPFVVIHVAQGVYRPSEQVDPADPRSVSFVMIADVAILGGFAGYGAVDPDERDVAAYTSVLSGDLDGNDGPDFTNRSDNCYHVVFNNGNYLTSTAVLDGFTLSGGHADVAVQYNSGGGIFIQSSSPTLNGCTLTDNWAYNSGGVNIVTSQTVLNRCTIADNRAGHIGGGIIVSDGSVTLNDCVISGNMANLGGGMSIFSSDSTLVGCIFVNNGGINDGGALHNLDSSPTLIDCDFIENNGGAILNDLDSAPLVKGCTFERNWSDESGGAIANLGSSPIVYNCIFRENSTDETGGALFNYISDPSVTHCVFVGNTALVRGGAVANDTSSPILTNCVLWANSSGNPPSSDEISNDSYSFPAVTYCDVEGGYAGAGNIDADPLFADGPNGDFHLTWNSPCRDSGDNSASTEVHDFEGDPRIALGTSDMGADEYYYRLYHMGDVIAGSPVDVKVVGFPNAPVRLFLGSGIADPPYSTQHGDFLLNWPPLWQGTIGSIPGDGILVFPATVPAGWPSGSTHPLQSLVGPWGGPWTRLTNLDPLTVD